MVFCDAKPLIAKTTISRKKAELLRTSIKAGCPHFFDEPLIDDREALIDRREPLIDDTKPLIVDKNPLIAKTTISRKKLNC